MEKKSKDKGVIFVLLDRFNKQRHPRALEMEKRLNKGEVLSKIDHEFIKQVFSEAGEIKQLVERNPEYRELYEKAVVVWHEILEKDLENQKKSGN